MPEVSVIIPTHNRAEILRRAIESVLAQSYDNFELIIVDDAGTDNTEGLINSFDDGRIRYSKHKTNRGGSAARNTGIALAKGRFIAFLDDDDEWLPNKLKLQLEKFALLPEDVGLVYGAFSFLAEDCTVLEEFTPKLCGHRHAEMLESCFLPIQTTLVRAECFKLAGNFDETLPSCQDWDFWIRLTKHYAVDFIEEQVTRVYVHGEQITANLGKKIKAREILLAKYYSEIIVNTAIHGAHLQRLGVLHCLDGNLKIGRVYFKRAIRANPTRKGHYLHLVLSIITPNRYLKLIKNRNTHKLGSIVFYY